MSDQPMGYQKLKNADKLSALLADALAQLMINLGDDKKYKLLRYLDNLLLWNKAYNLTAINDEQEALIKHIIDCLAIVNAINDKKQPINTLLDVGTGAGLPSVVLAIVQDDWQIVAVDSNAKKIRFVKQMISELGLSNLTANACRIEHFHGSFDVIVSWAFASLSDFVAQAAPYLAQNGVMVAMKGKTPTITDGDERYTYAVCPLTIPFLPDDRCVVFIKANADIV